MHGAWGMRATGRHIARPHPHGMAPLADNAAGDEEFRADQAAWYKSITGKSLDVRLSLGEQGQQCDAVARRFPVHTLTGVLGLGSYYGLRPHCAGRTHGLRPHCVGLLMGYCISVANLSAS